MRVALKRLSLPSIMLALAACNGSEPQPGGILSLLREVIILLAAGGLTWAEKGDGRD